MADDRIVISIELDDGSVRQGFLRVQQAAKDSADKSSSFFRRVGEFASGAILADAIVSSIKKITDTLVSSTKYMIKAAEEEDAALTKLNASLVASGSFSEMASQSFQNMAEELKRVTAFSDDQILSSSALARSFANSNEQAQKLVRAAVDLASATGTDLDTAITKLGATLQGSAAGLGRMSSQVRSLTKEQLYAGDAIDIIGAKFKGAASAASETYANKIIQLGNAFNDVAKQIGKFITQSPSVGIAISEITKLINNGAQFVKDAFGSKDIFKDLLINFSVIAQAGIETARRIGASFELAFLNAQKAWYAFKVLTTAGFSDTFNKQLLDVNDRIDELKVNFGGGDSAATQFFTNLIDKLTASSGRLREFGSTVQQTAAVISDSLAMIDFSTITDSLVQGFTTAIDYSGLKINDLAGRSAKARESLIADMRAIGTAARDGLGNAIGSGFAAFGRALVTGQNALEAFAKAFIGAIGQAAISEGTALILRGIAYSFDPFLAGFAPGMIAAGAALATLGGVLTAVGGASPITGGAAGGIGSGGSITSPDAVDVSESIDKERQQRVVVNIQGDVLDSRESSLRIVDLINEAVNTQGAVLMARA
jgi:hypothetical protein